MLEPFSCYRNYIAIKCHFSSDFDYFKFNGKIKADRHSFEKRKDKAFFYKLGKKYNSKELIDFLVANFLYNEELWIGDMLHDNSFEIYENWQRRVQAMTQYFRDDIRKLLQTNKTVKASLVVKKGQHPAAVTALCQDEITIETVAILNKIYNFIPTWNKTITDTVIWPRVKSKIENYTPFLNLSDCETYKKIINEEEHGRTELTTTTTAEPKPTRKPRATRKKT